MHASDFEPFVSINWKNRCSASGSDWPGDGARKGIIRFAASQLRPCEIEDWLVWRQHQVNGRWGIGREFNGSVPSLLVTVHISNHCIIVTVVIVEGQLVNLDRVTFDVLAEQYPSGCHP